MGHYDNSANGARNRAGLSPVVAKYCWRISTRQAEEYLQKKFSELPGCEREIITLQTIENISNIFKPFLLLMSQNVLKYKNGRNDELGAVESLFVDKDENSHRKVLIKDPVYRLLVSYAFTDGYDHLDDKGLKARFGINRQGARIIHEIRKPFLDGNRWVGIGIDPILLFGDMLAEPDKDNSRYALEIPETKRIEEGNWEYSVVRSPRTSQAPSKSKDSAAEVIRRAIRY